VNYHTRRLVRNPALSVEIQKLNNLDGHGTSEERMQVSLVYSGPDVSEMKMREFVKNYKGEKSGLHSDLEELKRELITEGIDICTEIIPIETLALPA
jgi:hypothetical protein